MSLSSFCIADDDVSDDDNDINDPGSDKNEEETESDLLFIDDREHCSSASFSSADELDQGISENDNDDDDNEVTINPGPSAQKLYRKGDEHLSWTPRRGMKSAGSLKTSRKRAATSDDDVAVDEDEITRQSLIAAAVARKKHAVPIPIIVTDNYQYEEDDTQEVVDMSASSINPKYSRKRYFLG